MRNPKGTTDQLSKSLARYNPITGGAMPKVAKILALLGIAILGILLMVELANTQKKFQSEDGGLTIELLTNTAPEYVIAYVCIMGSSYITNGIAWPIIQIARWISSVVTAIGTSGAIPQMERVSWWAEPIVFLLQIPAHIALILSSIIADTLIFPRRIQLYMIKALALLFVAFFVHDELCSIAMGYMKQITAYMPRDVLLVLLLGLTPILAANDHLSFRSPEGGILTGAGAIIINVMTYPSLVLRYVAVIILLVGSQGFTKRLVGTT